MRVEPARLSDDGFRDTRMTVADDRNVVVRVQQPPAVRVKEPDSLAADDVNRVLVREIRQRRPEQPPPAPCQLACRDRRCRSTELARHLVRAGCCEELE